MKCPDQNELLRLVDKQLDPESAAGLQRHTQKCTTCSQQIEELKTLFSELLDPPHELHDPTFVSHISTLIDLGQATTEKLTQARFEPRPSRWRRVGFVSALLAATVIAFVLLGPLRQYLAGSTPLEDHGFQSRGQAAQADQWVDLKVLTAAGAGGQDYQMVDTRIETTSALAFVFSNQDPRQLTYLMVLGVDDDGEVYWYYPAHTDPNRDPESIRVCHSCAEVTLLDEVEHNLHPGSLRLFALFSKEPLQVSQLERQVAAQLQSAHNLGDLTRIAVDDSAQRSYLLTVRSRRQDSGQLGQP